MESGYYWIEVENRLFPARWDGENWHYHGQVHSHEHHVISNLSDPAGGCQTGCTCTKNPDGTWNISCP